MVDVTPVRMTLSHHIADIGRARCLTENERNKAAFLDLGVQNFVCEPCDVELCCCLKNSAILCGPPN